MSKRRSVFEKRGLNNRMMRVHPRVDSLFFEDPSPHDKRSGTHIAFASHAKFPSGNPTTSIRKPTEGAPVIQSSPEKIRQFESVIDVLRLRRRELVNTTNSEWDELCHVAGIADNKETSGYDIDDSNSDFVNSRLVKMQFEELGQIDKALKRIADGHYGSCECCSGTIPLERLEALPFTSMCVACQSESEESGTDW